VRPIILALATAGLGLALAVWSVPKIAASLAKAPAVAPQAAVPQTGCGPPSTGS
jgi:hypothetical protein